MASLPCRPPPARKTLNPTPDAWPTGMEAGLVGRIARPCRRGQDHLHVAWGIIGVAKLRRKPGRWYRPAAGARWLARGTKA